MTAEPLRDLEARLGDLAAVVELPDTPPLSGRVSARLRSEPAPGRRRGLRLRARWSRVPALGLAAVVLLAAIALTLSPSARRAVAGWLGLPGVRIQAEPPPGRPPAVGSELDLGRRTTLADAERRTPFELLLPRSGRLGDPDAVFVDYPPSSGRVSLVYRAEAGLPRAHHSGVGLLLMQFEELLKKSVFEGSTVEPVTVGGEPGYWIGGRAHVVRLIDPGGGVLEDSARFADHTLLWRRSGVTFRLESALSKGESLRLAASVR
jgi:hypothetical protein